VPGWKHFDGNIKMQTGQERSQVSEVQARSIAVNNEHRKCSGASDLRTRLPTCRERKPRNSLILAAARTRGSDSGRPKTSIRPRTVTLRFHFGGRLAVSTASTWMGLISAMRRWAPRTADIRASAIDEFQIGPILVDLFQ